MEQGIRCLAELHMQLDNHGQLMMGLISTYDLFLIWHFSRHLHQDQSTVHFFFEKIRSYIGSDVK